MKVLVADDSPTSRLLLDKVLTSWGYQVVTAEDGARALAMLSAPDGPNLAVLDWMMPELDGVDVCRALRKLPGERRPYLILLTAKDSKEDVATGLDAGADDYLSKPFAPEELRARLGVGRRFVQLYDELMAAQRELERQARTDPLTGILNRGAIVRELEVEIERLRRERGSLCVAMLDIDHFKRVNDTYGHSAGDLVLKEFVRRVETIVRPYDRVGRFGGEEFLLLMPGTFASEALAVCERIRAAVCEAPVETDDAPIPITVSIGVAGYRGQPVNTLLTQADAALYRAKEQGRNRVEFESG